MGINIKGSKPLLNAWLTGLPQQMRHVPVWQQVGEAHYQVCLDDGQWLWCDDVSGCLTLDFHVPYGKHVMVIITRAQLLCESRHIHIKLDEAASLHFDLLDGSNLSLETWDIDCARASSVKVNHVLLTQKSRQQQLTSRGQEKSQIACHYAIKLDGMAKLLQQARFTLDANDSQVHHQVHGVALQSAKGIIESFVHMPQGATRVASQQSLKTFAMNKASWQMQPDLIIEHQDVMASHGACHGLIDPAYLVYAKSRGLSKDIFQDIYYNGFLLSALTKPSALLKEQFGAVHE